MSKRIGAGLNDVYAGLKKISLPIYLANSDIRRRYRRSSLGPFWITLSTAIMVACIGLIFGRLFKSNTSEFIPFIAAGLILWTFISSVVNESCSVFANSEAVIRQLPLPLFTHVERMIAKNFIIFLHNVIIFPFVCLIVSKPIGFEVLLVFPGLLLLIINLAWVGLLLGIICTRYRDMTQIIASILQIAFYATPIIWLPSLLIQRTGFGSIVLYCNPLYHLIEIIRAPMLSSFPSALNWFVSVCLAFVGWTLTIFLFNKYKDRVPYWL